MTEMKPDDKLDLVLKSLDNESNRLETFTEIKHNIGFSLQNKELDIILEKLILDKNVGYKNGKTNNIINEKEYYYITFQGRQFLNHSFIYKNRPYKAKATLAKINKVWTIIKTTVVVINAVIILSIAAIGVWVSYEGKEKDKKIEKLESELENLRTTRANIK